MRVCVCMCKDECGARLERQDRQVKAEGLEDKGNKINVSIKVW